MDRLSEILDRFTINAHVFFSGNLCGTQSFGDEANEVGHLHLLKTGHLSIRDEAGNNTHLQGPSVLFFPRKTRHRIIAEDPSGVEVVCAEINYPDKLSNPLTNALPAFLYFDLSDPHRLTQTATWLFEEAFSQHYGRQPMIDRLCDIFLISVLRRVLEESAISSGMLAGLAHPQLAPALTAIHKSPAESWTLDSLAALANMSRSKFAEVFKQQVGQTPGDYISDWRVAISQNLLLKKKNVNLVANLVGYENGSTFARVFRKKTGLSPREWLAKNQQSTSEIHARQ